MRNPDGMGRSLRRAGLIAALGTLLLAAMGVALTIGPAKLPLGQVLGMIASPPFPFGRLDGARLDRRR